MEPLVSISPALNIILFHLSDSAHSEYGAIIKQVHLLLLGAILTPGAPKSLLGTITVLQIFI